MTAERMCRCCSLRNATVIGRNFTVASHFAAPPGNSSDALLPLRAGWAKKSGMTQRGVNSAERLPLVEEVRDMTAFN